MDLRSLELVRVELGDNIAELRLCRPKALNALNKQMLRELDAALAELAQVATLRCLIIAGEGERAFVAGADIAEMAHMKPEEAAAFSAMGQGVFERLERLPVPVLAAVNGYALGGGCELALACDIIYAADNAKLGQPEVKLGLIPGFGGSVRLVRKIGYQAAADWILSGEVYPASRAQELGLVHEVLKPEALMPRVREVAKVIASRGPLAVRAAKRVMLEALRGDMASALGSESKTFGSLFATADMREGTAAFLEKRDAEFKGA